MGSVKRRGGNTRPAGVETRRGELEVVGFRCRFFDDDAMADFVNSGHGLQSWNGDENNLMVDRFDVRHLLSDASVLRRRRSRAPSPDVSDQELDFERYRDLEEAAAADGVLDNSLPDEDAEVGRSQSGGYQSVGFNYNNAVGDKARPSGEPSEGPFFSPPFPVPEDLLTALPPTEKLHQIMAGTAKFVSEHGGQAEIVLRVKQAKNPTFGFLMPDHHLHPYFRFLVDHPELVRASSERKSPAAESSANPVEGALSILGATYGGEEENDGEEENMAETSISRDGNIKQLLGDLQIETMSNLNHQQTKMDGNSSVADESLEVSDKQQTSDRGTTVLAKEVHNLGSQKATSNSIIKISVSLGPELRNNSRMEDVTVDDPNAIGTAASGMAEYKEPPIHLKRIIDKMVEFISRNGKEFEGIVRERDKTDGRFHFLLPWNEYHPYYRQSLEESLQVRESALQQAGKGKGSDSNSGEASPPALQPLSFELQPRDRKDKVILTLSREPFVATELGDVIRREKGGKGAAESHGSVPPKEISGTGGMSSAAAAAAVRAVTRRQPHFAADKNGEQENGGYGKSIDAVAAAIRAATNGSKKVSLARIDGSGELSSSGRAALASATTDMAVAASGESREAEESKGSRHGGNDAQGHSQHNSGTPDPTSWVSMHRGEADISAAKLVAKAASKAATHEGDSIDAHLNPEEKRKAERLKKAKMFAAMIKEGSETGFNSVGISISIPADVDSQGATSGSTHTLQKSESLNAVNDVQAVKTDAGDMSQNVGLGMMGASSTGVGDGVVNESSNFSSLKVEGTNEMDLHRHRHHKRKKSNVGSEEKERHKQKKHSSHGKRPKHKETALSTDEEDRGHRHKKNSSRPKHKETALSTDEEDRGYHHKKHSSRRRHRESGLSDEDEEGSHKRHKEHRSKRHTVETRVVADQGKLKSNSSLVASPLKEAFVKEAPLPSESVTVVDVPDDIRAKVRAMLLQMN